MTLSGKARHLSAVKTVRVVQDVLADASQQQSRLHISVFRHDAAGIFPPPPPSETVQGAQREMLQGPRSLGCRHA